MQKKKKKQLYQDEVVSLERKVLGKKKDGQGAKDWLETAKIQTKLTGIRRGFGKKYSKMTKNLDLGIGETPAQILPLISEEGI